MPFLGCHMAPRQAQDSTDLWSELLRERGILIYANPPAFAFLDGTGTRLKISAIPLCTDAYAAIRRFSRIYVYMPIRIYGNTY